MTKLNQLAEMGQAIWLDYIQRSFIASGMLQQLIDIGLRGMTSNPTIFEKAITGSNEYDSALASLATAGCSAEEIYTILSQADIRQAADLLLPVYVSTDGADGYVSLEVDPRLANDCSGTLAEAQRLWMEVDCPNLMIKIPATRDGLPAIREAIAKGINVNVTLIFSLARYREVINAFLNGLEDRLAEGLPINKIASVASFFVSRVDSKVDKRLEEIIRQEELQAGLARSILGRAAVANARLAYAEFKLIFESERFTRLSLHGARRQRPLWASTSTKNPAYSDILYVQELIGPHTVNTLPHATIEAFLDHGEVWGTLEKDVDQARQVFDELETLGISMEKVTEELEVEGVAAFRKSFEALLEGIEVKRKAMLISALKPRLELSHNLARYEAAVIEVDQRRILPRIWAQDHTVWKDDRTEITNRLGWLHVSEDMRDRIGQLEAISYTTRQAGYTHTILLGMGGSSLAPELFARTFGSHTGYPSLSILDSTDPGAVLAIEQSIDLAHCLFIVSTKSGTTEETLSFFKYFYNKLVETAGIDRAGEHFIAITDPGSKLASLAQQYKFRATFLNDPNIGGRYSALSYFGLLPAALCGIDLTRLLASVDRMASFCSPIVPAGDNPAVNLGVSLAELAVSGHDKATFFISSELASFGDWVEQLIAESTGKEGRGILPVVGEQPVEVSDYPEDRQFIYIYMKGDITYRDFIASVKASGKPVIEIKLDDLYDLGGQFFLWELATAIAGQRLQINPFDQPNVEAAKNATRAIVSAYNQSGQLVLEPPVLTERDISVYGHVSAHSPKEALEMFLEAAQPGDYIALQAFIQPTVENTTALQELRKQLQMRYRLATTFGYGPRFLHSTGQLHKGDAGNGWFIQFTAQPAQDVPIPSEAGSTDTSISFGVLILAQALGDHKALQDAGRHVIRFHLGERPGFAIRQLLS